MDRIDMMRAFAQVARDGSFTAAARRLGLSTRLVSKYVAALEERLGAQLLRRTTRSVSLTDAGAACLDQCRALVAQYDELDAAARERRGALSGPIRLTAPTGFGATRLPEALGSFMEAHPEVSIELRLSDARLSLVEEGLDLAVRIGRPADSALVMRKLADMPLVVCAAPSYLSARGRPTDPAALAAHDCLIMGAQPEEASWRFGRGADAAAVRVSGPCVSNSPAALAALAVAGRGVARCPLYAVEAALADGRLVALFPEAAGDDLTLHAVYPPNRHLTARVRALIDHLAAAFGPRREW